MYRIVIVILIYHRHKPTDLTNACVNTDHVVKQLLSVVNKGLICQ
jgi:hypothetical protein